MRCPKCSSWNENEAAICERCQYNFLTSEAAPSTWDSPFEKYFSFRVLISPWFIKVAYVCGCILFTIAGLIVIVFPEAFPKSIYASNMNIPAGIAVLVLGNLAWRIVCEGAILFFSLHEVLVSLDDRAKLFAGIPRVSE